MALGLFFLGGDPAQVCNAGGPHALDEVRLREGSLLWPRFPAPLGMRGLTMMRFLAALNGLINVAGGKRAGRALGLCHHPAARHRPDGRQAVPDVRRHRRRLRRARHRRRHRRGLFRGAGELPGRVPGTRLPGAAAHATASYRDSGGAGRYRGGCGIVREYEVLAEEAMLAMRIDSVKNPPWGVAGGMAGGTGRAVVNPGTPRSACWRRCPTAPCCSPATPAARDRRRRRPRPSVRPPGRASAAGCARRLRIGGGAARLRRSDRDGVWTKRPPTLGAPPGPRRARSIARLRRCHRVS